MIRLRDALDREIALVRAPQRIVSLVPSETESVVELAGVERLVGRTEYCIEPSATIERVPTVGGTKRVDVSVILELAPDLVLANREENGRRDVERLIDAGVTVHVSFPQTVADSIAYLWSLVALLDLPREPVRALAERIQCFEPRAERIRVFAPIWKDPWMTFDERTYASDLLARLGADNAFAARPRRFPLAADVGDAPPIDAGDRDTRYPRTTPGEVVERRPGLVLLSDEPYGFGTEDEAEVKAWGLSAAVEHVSGKDLFWYGVRTASAMERLAVVIGRHIVAENVFAR